MRHLKKRHHLSLPADQRKALLRTLATSFIKYDEIVTTNTRAKAVKEKLDKLITLGKRGDVHSIRQAAKLVYNHKTGKTITTEKGKEIPETILRKLFATIAPQFKDRDGGYVRVIKAPPRRGDGALMAVIQLSNKD